MMTRLLFVVCITVLISGNATAGFYLTGAQIYWSNPNGSNFGTNNDSDYRWTTNTGGTGSANLIVTSGVVAPSSVPLASAISFALITGDYDFQFQANGFDSRVVNNLGLNLFFRDTDGLADNSYNPSALGTYPGDLTVTTAVGRSSSDFAFVGSNLTIMNYVFQGGLFPKSNGFQSFTVGDQIVTVTGFRYDLVSGSGGVKPQGSFKLSVTATPEPSTIGVGALAFCGLAHWVKKRRRRATVQASSEPETHVV